MALFRQRYPSGSVSESTTKQARSFKRAPLGSPSAQS